MQTACATRGLAAVAALSVAALCSGCDNKPAAAQAQAQPPAVTVSRPAERDVQDFDEFTGRTDAVEFVEIRARTTGYLEEIGFKEDSESKKGDVLYKIDPRPYQAKLDKATAAVASADATLKRTQTELERAEKLLPQKAISQEEYEKNVAQKAEAAASVTAAKAQAEEAQLYVDFTTVVSPIDGRISRSRITAGNLVTADSTLLTTIVSVDPIYAYFDVDERTVLRLQRLMREGKVKSRDETKIPVSLGLANEDGHPHEGAIDFVDNRVDPSTGTITVRGSFPNPKPSGGGPRFLAPGLFVRLRIPVGEPYKALLVPERALATDQGQKILFVVNDKNEVASRPVKIGRLENGQRVIEEGLAAADRVIVNGIQRVRAGIKVDPKQADDHAKPAAPENDDASER